MKPSAEIIPWHVDFFEEFIVTQMNCKVSAIMEPEGAWLCSLKPAIGSMLSQLNPVLTFIIRLSEMVMLATHVKLRFQVDSSF